MDVLAIISSKGVVCFCQRQPKIETSGSNVSHRVCVCPTQELEDTRTQSVMVECLGKICCGTNVHTNACFPLNRLLQNTQKQVKGCASIICTPPPSRSSVFEHLGTILWGHKGECCVCESEMAVRDLGMAIPFSLH